MQKVKRFSSRLWMCFLLSYSGLLFFFIVLGTYVHPLLILPFYLLIPGYAFITIFFHLPKLEMIVMSVGFSVALFVGVRGFMQTFGIGLFSELIILMIISVVCLIVKLIKQ